MDLFQNKRFKMHSGRYSDFKIECDALSDSELAALAKIAAKNQRFSEVLGVPRGGVRFAQALEPFKSKRGSILIVDDVLTTGSSMNDQREELLVSRPEARYKPGITGLVIFGRGILPEWVRCIFYLNMSF